MFACTSKGPIFKEYQKYSIVQQSDVALVGLFEQLTGGGGSVCEAVGGSWRDCLRCQGGQRLGSVQTFAIFGSYLTVYSLKTQ